MKSKQPRKQRKKLYNLPLHKRRKQLSARLSKELQEKYKKRSFPVVKGDKVKVMRGKFKGKEGKVIKVDLINFTLNIEGITTAKQKGDEIFVPIKASNVRITELNMNDQKRKKALMRKVGGNE